MSEFTCFFCILYSTDFVTFELGTWNVKSLGARHCNFFYIFRLRSNLHKDRVVCRILKYDLQACEDVNIPGPPPVLLNWLHRSSVFSLWHRFLYFFPSGPLCCLSLRSSSNSRPSTSLMLLTALWLYLPTLLAFSHQESHQSPALARACWLWEPWEVSHTCRWRMKKTTMT